MADGGVTSTEVIGIVLGAASVLFAVLAWRTSQKAVRVSEEQLGLSQEESRRHPKLELTNVCLVDAKEVDDVIRTREAGEKWRDSFEKAMEEDLEASVQQEVFKPFGEAAERLEKAAKNIDEGFTVGQALYDGHSPIWS